MKRLLGVILTASLIALAAPAAQAKDMPGKFGLGYVETLGGVRGLDIQYYVHRHFGLEAVLGLDYISSKDLSPMAFKMSIGGRYNVARAKDANFGVGLRANIGVGGKDYITVNYPEIANPELSVHFNLEIPLIFEYFLSNHFSIFTQVGLLIDFVPEKGAVLTDGAAGTTEVHFGATSLSSLLGATFWF